MPELSPLSDASDALTIHGVESRYPDDWQKTGLSEMNHAVELSKHFGDILLPKLEQ